MNPCLPWFMALSIGVEAPSPVPVSEKVAPRDQPPGGYWSPGERPVPEPSDGEWQIVTGSILLPLGVLGTAAAAASTYITAPSRCERLTNGELDEDECAGLYAFSWFRVVYSSLLTVSGAVFLAIGLQHRKRHRAWESQRIFAATPWLLRSPAGDIRAGVGLHFRF